MVFPSLVFENERAPAGPPDVGFTTSARMGQVPIRWQRPPTVAMVFPTPVPPTKIKFLPPRKDCGRTPHASTTSRRYSRPLKLNRPLIFGSFRFRCSSHQVEAGTFDLV